MFAEHGQIQSTHVQPEKNSGFVCFKETGAAAAALVAMNKKRLPDGSFLLVSQHISKRDNQLQQNSKAPAPIQQNLTKTFDSNLFVKNVPSSVTEEEFKKLFESFGKDTKTQYIPCNFVSAENSANQV